MAVVGERLRADPFASFASQRRLRTLVGAGSPDRPIGEQRSPRRRSIGHPPPVYWLDLLRLTRTRALHFIPR